MNRKKEIKNLSKAAVLDLKAELFKTKEDFDRVRQTTVIHSVDSASALPLSNSDSDRIKEYKKLNTENKLRLREQFEIRYPHKAQHVSSLKKGNKRTADNEEVETNAALEASWVALQRKSREYDRLKQMGLNQDEEDSDNDATGPNLNKRRKHLDSAQDRIPLVDFVKKHLDEGKQQDSDDDGDVLDLLEEDEDPWVEVADAFGRTRIVRKSDASKIQNQAKQSFVAASSGPTDVNNGEREGRRDGELVSSDMRREQMRQDWEKQAMAEINGQVKEALPLPKHFDPKREVRNLGVGFYGFSQEDDERNRQMSELEALRKDTIGSRGKVGIVKEERKAKLEERKALLKERKRKKETCGTVVDVADDHNSNNDVDAFLARI